MVDIPERPRVTDSKKGILLLRPDCLRFDLLLLLFPTL